MHIRDLTCRYDGVAMRAVCIHDRGISRIKPDLFTLGIQAGHDLVNGFARLNGCPDIHEFWFVMVFLAHDLFVALADDVGWRDVQNGAEIFVDRLDLPVGRNARNDMRCLKGLHFPFQNFHLGIFSLEPNHFCIRA